MAILPAPLEKPAKGKAGQFQNMEEWNAFTAFVSGTATKPIGFGHPVSRNGQAGDGTVLVRALATTQVFAGITRENITTAGTTQTVYADGEKIGVADEGVILGIAGAGGVTIGGNVFWNPTTNRYVGAAGVGFLPLPGCSYDQSAAAEEVVPIRLRVAPGAAAVTAGT